MKKSLSEMTLEELWQLFPIILKPHNPDYPVWYAEEKLQISSLFDDGEIYRITHIGSSSVEGLIAKPTVDILLEINDGCLEDDIITVLKSNGWSLMSRESAPMKLSFNKGYTPDGFAEKVYHLHVRRPGDWDELYFRDYLAAHPETAEEYGKLKLSLWKKYEHNRDGYTEAKTDFIRKYTTAAKAEFGDRYRPILRFGRKVWL